MTDTWFTSDPHYWHANVIKFCDRPYKDVEEMNEKLIANWNAIVKPDDTVYCLGDYSLAIRPVEAYSHRLMGTKILVPGNHDWCHPHNKKARGEGKLEKWTKKYEEHGWEVKPLVIQLDIPGVAIVNLSHMPYDTEDTRYVQYVPVDDGRVLLCGHVHEKWKTKFSKKGTLMINVGVDVWDYKPIHINDIKDIILDVHSKTKD